MSRGSWSCHGIHAVISIIISAGLFASFSELALAQAPLVVPGQYIVTLKALGANASEHLQSSLSRTELRVKKLFSGGKRALLAPHALAARSSDDFDTAPYDQSDAVCKELLKSGMIESCEQDALVYTQAFPNDPQFSSLWGLGDAPGAELPRAWDRSTGSADVVVAVIDTGIDYTHPDLAANVWVNPFEIAANGIDDDGNGIIDDVHGANMLTNSGNPYDDNGHGTHVSGTIGAAGNDGIGVAGINWNVRIMGLKFLSATGAGSVSAAIEAIDYVIDMKRRGINVRVSNNSWGGPIQSKALEDAIARANEAGVLFIAAAGNEYNNNDSRPAYPASYNLPNVVSVAAIDKQGNLATFSNYGASSVDIAAPGVDILSTTPRGTYSRFQGTSMATPHVAGALALLLSAEPALSNEQAVERLYATALPLDSLTGSIRTGRTLNISRLLWNEASALPQPTPEPPPCAYSVTQITDAPDTRADGAPPIMAATDEGNYASLSIPFEFPFDAVRRSQVTVSANGVLYVGNAGPAGLDWENDQFAPLGSIAALHSDLVSTVRAAADASGMTIAWQSTRYASGVPGTVDIRLTLLPDGRIRQWLNFSSSSFQKAVSAHATVGLTGRSLDSSTTYAHNSKRIVDGLALEYRPLCQGDANSPLVESVSMWGIVDGHRSNRIVPEKGLEIKLSAQPSGSPGTIQALFRLDGQTCDYAPQISLTPGRTSVYRSRVPRLVGKFKKLSVGIQSVTTSRRIDDLGTRSASASRQRLSARRFGAVCRSLSNSLKQVQ